MDSPRDQLRRFRPPVHLSYFVAAAKRTTLSFGVEVRRQAAEVLIVVPNEGGEHALQTEAGQGMVEYALILAFIALAAVVALGLLGTQVTTFFSDLVTFMQSL